MEPMSRLKKAILIVCGCLLVGVGVVGVFLPILPSTIFFILAFACFTRSSERLANWLYNHPKFGEHLRAWEQDRVIPLKAKWLATIMMSSSVFILVFAGVPVIWISLVVVCLLLVAGYIWHCPHAKQVVRAKPKAKV